MNLPPRMISLLGYRHVSSWGIGLFLVVVVACVSSPPPSPFPPSESDLALLGPSRLCQLQSDLDKQLTGTPIVQHLWGTGTQIARLAYSEQPDHDRFYFFDEDHVLIGVVFRFVQGVDLQPYPILRRTLSALSPSLEFYMDATPLLEGAHLDTAVLYRTGDKTSTTRYVVLEGDGHSLLLLATVVLDPYEPLLAQLQQPLLAALGKTGENNVEDNLTKKQQEDFLALQQFARGETAWFASCGTRHQDIAREAYQGAIDLGFSDKAHLADAHHKLALVLKDLGQFQDATMAIEQALLLSPNHPTMLNSLGIILKEQGKHARAIKTFEQAIALKPNYARARFNLAEAMETINVRRAIEEYETYLVLVEGIPEEESRAALAEQRVRRLKGQ